MTTTSPGCTVDPTVHGPHGGQSTGTYCQDHEACTRGLAVCGHTPPVRELILDEEYDGVLATNGSLVYYLTRCCRASAKGSAGSPTGVVCRACYRTVPSDLGAAWDVDDTDAWADWMLRWTRQAGYPLEEALTVAIGVMNTAQDYAPRFGTAVPADGE